MGASLCPGGATFRAWAPRANAVYLNGTFGSAVRNGPDPDLLLQNTNGYWAGFLPGVADGDTYVFVVLGDANTGTKRDPYARGWRSMRHSRIAVVLSVPPQVIPGTTA